MFDLWGPPHDTARMRFAVLESSPPTCIRRASARSQDCYHKLCQGYHAGLGWCDVETVDSKICDRPLHGLSRALDEAIRLSQTSVGCLRSSIPPWPSCPELPCPHVSTLKRLSSVMQAAWKSPHDIHTHRAMYQGHTLVAVSMVFRVHKPFPRHTQGLQISQPLQRKFSDCKTWILWTSYSGDDTLAFIQWSAAGRLQRFT